MKPFAKRLLALASAAAIIMSAIPAVHGVDPAETPEKIVNEWADLETSAIQELTTAQMRTAAPNAPLSRQDLCGMAMSVYRSLTGIIGARTVSAPLFIDTDDLDVLEAYRLGFVTEKIDGIFAPGEEVSRQDFFTSAVKLLETAGYPYVNDIFMDLSGYADCDQLLAYAKQPVQVLLCIGAIEADKSLEPNRPITAEEAVVILGRMVSFYTAWLEDPVEPQRYLGEDVAEFALNYVGCRYVRGGQGPNKFDCSGFVYYVYKNFGYALKPGARNQWSILDRSVKKADLLPGDLLFFSSNGRASRIFHVGIYIGDGQFVHAANSRKGLIVTDIDDAWYAARYLGAKRVIE